MQRPAGAKDRVLRPPQIRDANRAAVLQLLRHNEHMSRADIARRCGLSEGTVSRIMGGLIADNLVREEGEESSTGGRPGRRLQLEPAHVAFGVDIQNWETRVAVSTMCGRFVDSRRFRTPETIDATLRLITDTFVDWRRGFDAERVAGIGIAARGIVNSDAGVLVLGSRPEWTNIPVRALLEAAIGEPVYLENNVRAAALAEYNYGASEVCAGRCLVFVKVDEGVGMGLVIDGRLHAGPRMAAGEFGQMVIAMSSGQERHDRPGCLERMAANPALCERYAALTGSTPSDDTLAYVRHILQSAMEGHAAACESVRETARCLGIGVSNVVWGLDADVVVIDGAITEAWPVIEPVIREQLPDEDSLTGIPVLLRPSALGGNAALIGAATLPFTTVFTTGETRRAFGAGA